MQTAQNRFILHSEYQPTGDQPQAIEKLVKGFKEGNQCQTLLGVTGSGKTFTMANVIQALNKPTLDYSIQINQLQRLFEISKQLHLLFVFSIFQGEIWREGQIKYYMQSHESGSHNNPHVHVNIGHKYEASIDIINGNILAGRVPQKYYGKIIKKIKDNKDFLMLCWNELTDGMKIDINYGLGIASYQ